MRALRSTWGGRLLAAVLVLSLLLPVAFRPAEQAAVREGSTYAAWLRTQAEASGGEAFAQALEAAQEAGTLHSFLRSFVEAYEAQAPTEPLAEIFAAGERTGEVLIRYLMRRYLRVGGPEAPTRLAWRAALPALPALDRLPLASGGTAVPEQALPQRAALMPQVEGLLAACAFRLLSSARPLGP